MTIATFPITLAIGETLTITRRGDFLAVLEAQGRVKVWLDDEAPFDFSAGLALKTPATFDRVRIENVSGAENTLELAIGFGELRDARLNVLGSVDVSGSLIRQTPPDQFLSGAAVITASSASLVLASNSNRAEATLSLDAAATDTVFIKGGAGATANGIPLAPGQSITLTVSASIYAYNVGASDATVYFSQLVWSA